MNPAGAIAKTNRPAITQPPTVIIQSTSSGQVFNYKDDCFIFYPPAGAGFQDESGPRIAAGKIDGANQFTVLMAFGNSGYAAAYIGSFLLGTSAAIGSSAAQYVSYVGNNPFGAW